MSVIFHSPFSADAPGLVAAGTDRLGEHHGLGVSRIDFKVCGQDSAGLFVLENIFHQPGGPARPLHVDQDEWFYIAEGEFAFEIGQQRLRLKAGDSILGPRQVSHVCAFDGEGTGRIVIAFQPAGKMEQFFREVTKQNAMPPQDPELWRSHGMQLLGPPLISMPPPASR